MAGVCSLSFLFLILNLSLLMRVPTKWVRMGPREVGLWFVGIDGQLGSGEWVTTVRSGVGSNVN